MKRLQSSARILAFAGLATGWVGCVTPDVSHPMPPVARVATSPNHVDSPVIQPVDFEANQTGMPLNLPTALSMVDGQHPAVGIARWRVQEAYARLSAARVMWLPTIQAGIGFHRHDGNYQASNGDIVDVNRNSFQFGLGNGATGAGTTPIPGLVAQFHLADAIFQPRIAQKTAWARGHQERSIVNRQLRDVAQAYTELLAANQEIEVLQQSQQRTDDLAKLTIDFAESGEGLQADADRLRTEQRLLEGRLVTATQRVSLASARLAQALSLPAEIDGGSIVPMDAAVLPLLLVDVPPPGGTDDGSLIQMGLTNRPELKESQALVTAACEAYQRERVSPMVPSVMLGFSNTGFGGGLAEDLESVDGRYDFDALLTWQLRNSGFGEKAARRTASARVQQARFEKLQQMDQVAREITDAVTRIRFSDQRMAISREAIAAAEESHRRNVERIRDGEGLPLEVLQSVTALEQASTQYLAAVVDYNQAQFELQWALGWPVQDVGLPEPVLLESTRLE